MARSNRDCDVKKLSVHAATKDRLEIRLAKPSALLACVSCSRATFISFVTTSFGDPDLVKTQLKH